MENKPQIPTLKESQNEKKGGAPMLRIKGLQSGMSLMERLKQFKKKDLAFILAGLGVLFMAPLAEHFMMSPNDQGGDAMTPGFSKNGTSSPFGSGSSPYEPGISGLAPGGTVGNGSDVITPLNVRDPSALVMGPGATQQAPATASQPSAAPPPPPPSKDDSKWNDAIAAGKAAASAATKKAALPVPHVPLSAGGLRGLGAVSGGSGSSFSLPAITSNGLASGHVNQSNGLTGTSGSGFKGVARGPNTGGTGNLEKLKQAAGNAGGDFNRSGSATTALEQAASRDMGGGSGGGAGEGGGKDDKATSGSQNKDSKSPGESLEFLRQKMQMEKDIAFADELRKNDPSCLFDFKKPCMERNKIFAQGEETLIGKGLVEPIAGAMGDMIKGWLDPGAGKVFCYSQADPKKWSMMLTKPGNCGATKDAGTQGYCFSGGFLTFNGQPAGPGDVVCTGGTGDGSTPDKNTVGGADGVQKGPVDNGVGTTLDTGSSFASVCSSLKTGAVAATQTQVAGAGGGPSHTDVTTTVDPRRTGVFQELLKDAGTLAVVKAYASGDVSDQTPCGGTTMGNGRPAVTDPTTQSLKPNLDRTNRALLGLTQQYKDEVQTVDTNHIAHMAKSANDANTVLKQSFGDANAQGIPSAQVDALFANAEKSYQDAAQVKDNAQQKDQNPWQKYLDGSAYQNIVDQRTAEQKLMNDIGGAAKQVQTDADAVLKMDMSDGVKKEVAPYVAQLKSSAKHWADTVGSDGQFAKTYKAQGTALSNFQDGVKNDAALGTAHNDALAVIDAGLTKQKSKAAVTVGAWAPESQVGAAAANGAADAPYRTQVKSALAQYKSDMVKAEADEKGTQEQQAAAPNEKKAAQKTAVSALQKAYQGVMDADGDQKGKVYRDQGAATTWIQEKVEANLDKATPTATPTPAAAATGAR